MAATRPGRLAGSRVSGSRLPGPSGPSGSAALARSRLAGGPDFADAVRFARVSESCLVSETRVRHVALSPRYLGRLRSGIAEQLSAELLQYSDSPAQSKDVLPRVVVLTTEILKGVPVAYDNVKLLSAFGDMIDEQGYVHFDVQVDFVIFRPKPGDVLKGVVNKVGAAHVGCLVHGCFNASLACPRDATAAPWPGSALAPGEAVRFVVTHVDSDWAGVLLVRGSLGLPDESNAERANGVRKHEREEEAERGALEPTNSTPSKKGKGKQNHDRKVKAAIPVEEDAVEGTHKKRKKRKKSKRKGESDGEEPGCAELAVKQEPRGELCEIDGLEEAGTSHPEDSAPSLRKRKTRKTMRPSGRGEEGSAMAHWPADASGRRCEGHAANGSLTSDLEAPKKGKKRKRSLAEEVSPSESPLPRSKKRK